MKYTIVAKCIEWLELEVEADSFEEAYEKAELADGGEFRQVCADWFTDQIMNLQTRETKYYA